MARLDPAKRSEWKNALTSVTAPWIAIGIDHSSPSMAARLEGIVGLADWALHGQVSRLLLEKKITDGESCIVPGNSMLSRPSFLFFPVRGSGSANSFLEKMQKLQVTEVALAESTFPEDFLAKVKQTFKKEGIRFTSLEPSA